VTEAKTPLAEIRSAELAAARSVSEATETAKEQVAEARASAQEAIEQARVEGRADADRRFAEAVERARAEAAVIAEEIDDGVERLRSRIEPRIEELAAAMLEELLPERND
jgi:vacuolar-type H+-ATPase subunit H